MLLLNFVNDDPKCNSSQGYAEICERYLFSWSCSINYLEFYSLKVEHCIFQQCLLLNSLGHISQSTFSLLCLPSTHLPPARKIGGETVGWENRAIVFMSFIHMAKNWLLTCGSRCTTLRMWETTSSGERSLSHLL